jgi:hypothetical protein
VDSVSGATNQLHILLASGRALLERVQREEIDPRAVMAAYQQWYTPTLAVVDLLMPERRLEFESYYQRTDGVGSPTPCIADILAAPSLTGERKAGLGEIFDPATPRLIFLHLLGLQLAILGSARTVLPIGLGRLESIVAAGLLDAELAAARELLACGRRRAPAVLAGVVVEHHLATLARRQGLMITRRSGIAKLAKSLRKAGLLDGSHYREIRRLAKLADRCRTAKAPAPSRKQVRRLIARAQEIVREAHQPSAAQR